ncbi:MAG TPA: multidrug ABC transporter permease [Clostridiales bacterium]|nr:multidrug ABC transporter permease [Clostridiales bacterium]
MFANLRRMMKMHRIFIAQDLKRMMEYKIDFLTGAFSFLLGQAINIIFLAIIFSQIPTLIGWTFEEIVFIYGFSLLPKALDHLFCDNLWRVGYFIVDKGDFDKYLTRPINPLFSVIVELFQVDALGELIVGLLLIGSTIGQVSIHWSVLNVILFLIVLPFATLIYTGVKTITAAIAFWTKRSGHITHMFYMVNDFAKYPTNIYNSFIKTVITYIIPFAFTAFYPASYFLTGENPWFNIGGTVVISVVLFTVAVFVWNKGVSAYESAGS